VVAAGEGRPEYNFAGLRAEAVRTRRGLGVAVSTEHPLAARREVAVDELADESWIVGTGGEGEPQFGAWPTLDTPHVTYEAKGWPTRLGLVAAGLDVSVLPGLAADTVPAGVKWVRVIDPVLVHKRQTVLVTSVERSAGASAMV
jgi:DNA-binding transcriptional LysR family regulator